MFSQSVEALGQDGAFVESVDQFRPRDVQQRMAQSVEKIIETGGILVAESGTGTGKTFAYLVPALLSGKRVVVSTGTRHLQDQLYFRDLPSVQKVLGVSVDVALLKGRSNYLCKFRLGQLGQDPALRYRKDLQVKKEILTNWDRQTRRGEISEVTEIDEQDIVWRTVTSTTDNCIGSECPDFKECYVNKARQRALKSQMVVVNHHLFFSDASLKEEGFGELLPPYDVVIFDEAHQLPDIASRFFGFTLSSLQLKDLGRDIKVAEAKEKSGHPLDDLIDELNTCLSQFDLAMSGFARGESREAMQDPKKLVALNSLLDNLAELELSLSQAAVAGEGLERCHSRCMQLQGYLLQWMESTQRVGELVCWYETSRSNTRLTGTPLNIGKQMQTILQRPSTSAILTSATLAAGSDFSHYLNALGCDEVDTLQLDSPFDYANNALLYLPSGLPEPNDRAFPDKMMLAMEPVLKASGGRAFLLFTSYAMLHQIANRMEAEGKWTLLVQGRAPRSELIDRFKTEPNTVLLGTASFWEGVDVKGKALSCVIIDKLPFVPPNDPVMRAKMQKLQDQGGNPFGELQIPEAIITLKQGAGRLIRDIDDKGVLMLCDTRLKSKGYGRQFLNSLPPMKQTDSLLQVTKFLSSVV
ncbi:MAG: ATP-dependent DNA helicase DinG [Saprospiraceae bacterium]